MYHNNLYTYTHTHMYRVSDMKYVLNKKVIYYFANNYKLYIITWELLTKSLYIIIPFFLITQKKCVLFVKR